MRNPKSFRFTSWLSEFTFFRLTPYSLLLTVSFTSAVHAGWVQQNSGTTAGLNHIAFIDVQTGWVGSDGGFLLHTTDGGANWKKVIVDPALQFVSALWFCDTSYGWVCGSEQVGLLSDLYATSDGGNHWSSLKRDSVQCYFDVEFVTPLKGWLVSSILMSNGGGKGFLYYTSDGGLSWVIRDSSVFPTHTIYWDVSFADSMMGMLAAGNPGVDGSSGYVKKTTDGGLNWAMIESGPLMFRRIRLLDCNVGWQVWFCDFLSQRSWGASKTTNGGNGWSGIFYRNTVSIAYPPFTLIDAQKGWIQMYDTRFGPR